MQLVLSTALREQALRGCHGDLGHLGIERTFDLLRDQFYWPDMIEDMLDISDTMKDAYDLKHLLTEHPWKMLMQQILWN